jgi:phosphatidylinositol-3-phosphatase
MILALALSNPVAATSHASSDFSGRAFNYLVVIVLENHGLSDIVGSADAPFINQLASTYGLASNYTAIDHPSLPNYLALVSGQDFFSWSRSDCGPGPGCNAGASQNIVDRLGDRGLSWKAYMEDYPSNCGTQCSPGNCFLGDSGLYAARHDPFVYFGDIANSTERCSHIVTANSSGNGPDDVLLSDLSSPSKASNLMWLTPNLCNDMHDCPISTGDSYLSNLVPKILSSDLFTHQKAALFITFDEGNAAYPKDYVYSVWAGPTVKKDFTSQENHSHYSFLSTLENVWHLHSLTSNDLSAPPMLEFFTSHPLLHHSNFERKESRDSDQNGVIGQPNHHESNSVDDSE